MANTTNKPVIFLAFANDRDDTVGYLRNLPDEARRLRDVLQSAEQAGLCEVIVRSNSTAADIFKVFQDPKYRNRIAIFHYGGHANGYELLLESAAGQAAAADAGGLSKFLGQQQGLQLVFLNGCSTLQQTQGLLEANISAVISTSRSIDDRIATDFSCQFYQGLGGGAGLQKSFDEAAAAVETTQGQDTRGLYLGDATMVTGTFDADQLPWLLFFRPGMEHVEAWNLPNAVDDPLFGLPSLPEQDLPETPYRHLNWFTHKDAEVYFGRGHQIRELYDRLTAPRTAPIMLFYGQSGVGKSSILDAGLIPRLERHHEVRYVRRGEGGLLDSLQQVFSPEASELPIETAWRMTEEQTGKPLIVFLDQVEECYTRAVADLPDELDQFLNVVKAMFVQSDQRPRGKLVLSFRKEWLAELEAELVDHELPRTKVFLEPLDHAGIIEVVQGPTRSERLRAHYGLTVEDGLAEMIADDLLADRDSAIAPTLQILLTKMWAQATQANYEQPQFTRDLYLNLKRDGILLRDFLNQQIAAFRERYPEAVDSGLLLDLVALHTTPLGTADQRTLEQLQQDYAHLGVTLPDLLQQCQDLHLLTIAAGAQKDSAKTTRLAHDTLAPLVREQFDISDKPGQRARRMLDNRSVDWAGEQTGTPLDAADLAIVEEGALGTRDLTPVELRLLEASRNERNKRVRLQRTLKISGSIAVLVIAVLAIVATNARNKAEEAVVEMTNALNKAEKSDAAARQNLRVAKEAVDEMLAKFASESLKDVPLVEQIRVDLLDKATDLYNQLSAQEDDSDALRREKAQAHYSLGRIYGILDERTKAADEYQQAVDQFTALVENSPETPEYRLDLITTLNRFGWLMSNSKEPAELDKVEAMYGQALQQFNSLDDESQQQLEYQTQKALTLNNRGVLRMDSDQAGEARQDFDDVIDLLSPYRDQAASSAAMKECLLYLAYAYNNRAMLLPESVSDYGEAIAVAEILHGKFPNDREIESELANWYNNLAGFHTDLAGKQTDLAFEQSDAGNDAEAEKHFAEAEKQFAEAEKPNREARNLFESLAAATPNVRSGLADSYITRVAILAQRDREMNWNEINVLMTDAKTIFAELNEADPDNSYYVEQLDLLKDYEDMLVPSPGADE